MDTHSSYELNSFTLRISDDQFIDSTTCKCFYRHKAFNFQIVRRAFGLKH